MPQTGSSSPPHFSPHLHSFLPAALPHTLPSAGSDEELARSLGFRTNPELTEKEPISPRLAQPVDFNRLSHHSNRPRPSRLNLDRPSRRSERLRSAQAMDLEGQSSNSDNSAPIFKPTDWNGRRRQSKPSHDGDVEPRGRTSEDPMPSPRTVGVRRVSFFDVGGLLEDGPTGTGIIPSPTSSVQTQDFASWLRPPSKSSVATPDVRLSQGPPRRSARWSQQSDDTQLGEYDPPPLPQSRRASRFTQGSEDSVDYYPPTPYPQSRRPSRMTQQSDESAFSQAYYPPTPYARSRRASRTAQQPGDYYMRRPSQQVNIEGLLDESDELFEQGRSASESTSGPSREELRKALFLPPPTRTSVQTSHSSVPSLQDAGGLLSMP